MSLKVRGALETFVYALTPLDPAKGPKNDVQPALMNSDLLSREVDSISLLLSLLVSLSPSDIMDLLYLALQLLTYALIVRGGFLHKILHIATLNSRFNKFSK